MNHSVYIPETDAANAGQYFFRQCLPPEWKMTRPFISHNGCMLLTDEGELSLSVNFLERNAVKGDCLLIAPGSLVDMIRISAETRVRSLVFPVSCWSDSLPGNIICADYSFPTVLLIPGDAPLSHLTGLYMQEAETVGILNLNDNTSSLICRRILDNLFMVTGELFPFCAIKGKGGPYTPANGLYERFVRLLLGNCSIQHEVSFYAESLSVTQKHLTATLRMMTGLSAKHCIDRYLMTMLKEEIGCSRHELKDIASAYGFPTQSYFCQYFIRHAGMTPRRFRKEFLSRTMTGSITDTMI